MKDKQRVITPRRDPGEGAGSREPDPDAASAGDAEADGRPGEALAAETREHLEAPRPRRGCGQRANVRTDGGRSRKTTAKKRDGATHTHPHTH